ncbi:uncharacterized protein [Anoplolepis gracilipes]|uniref:uncharacterized protein n=1 Tax=Anoplolepis gracilipes TaxID=354296 RepID=UPI003BA3E15B
MVPPVRCSQEKGEPHNRQREINKSECIRYASDRLQRNHGLNYAERYEEQTMLEQTHKRLTNWIERKQYDKAALRIRMNRELYHKYEEFNDELLLLETSDQHKEEFANVQDRFYTLVGKVERILNISARSAQTPASSADTDDTSNMIQPHDSGTAVYTKRRVKLPEASLPKFDGRYENWLSFKNSFIAMIDSQTDLEDVQKLQYLKSALTDEAANKLKILSIEGSNYAKAWELLKRSYETAVRVSKRVREMSKREDDKHTFSKKARICNKAFVVGTITNCTACKNKQHPLFKCTAFKQLTVPKRIEFVRNAKLCYNCLRSHIGKTCNYSSCAICQKRHNTLLHMETNKSTSTTNNAKESTVFVQDHDRNLIKCRTLLDTCATANFISEKFAKSLRLPITPYTSTVSAINSTNTASRGITSIVIQSLHNEYRKRLICLSIPTIANLVPAEIFPRHLIKMLSNIKLADPEFHIPRTVDLLLGSATTISLFSIGQIDLSLENRELYLQKTRLGWIVAGGITFQNHVKNVTCQLTSLERLITKFWTIEDLPSEFPKSPEDIECEKHFLENVTRDKDGRYTVRLPFRKSERRLGESRMSALKRLNSLERKFNSNNSLRNAYSQVIQEDLNQMFIIKDPIDNGFYLPHHAVIKSTSDTTKTRVVFDASAKSSTGTSLNMLMTGPTIQNTLFTHLIRFRTYKYVITADIEKMYQIWLHENDRIYQRLLWRHGHQITLQLNTLTFGVSSSPYLAIRTIHKLADDEGAEFPVAAQVLKNHLYVDDLLTGANTIDEACAVRDDVTALLSRGGFHIRQWASNNACVINDVEPDTINSNLILDKESCLKTLGISWHASNDVLRYSARSINHAERITKRIIFSEIAQIYDPLGILGPVILYAKRLMQNLWRNKLNWDESIPADIHTAWINFATQLELIHDISIERLVLTPDYANVQIHGFCDASQEGYGACIYLCSETQNREVHCQLLCAKSRVAPLKSTTIPRLELCGALLLAKLHDATCNGNRSR